MIVRMFVCLLLAVLCLPSFAMARDVGGGLAVSPLRSLHDIEPGGEVSDSVEVTNGTDAELTVRMSAEEFDVVNEHYDFSFNPSADVSKWIEFSRDTVSLQPDQSATMGFDIVVPAHAEPGGRYISIFATTSVPSTHGSISSQQRIASLIFVNVGGEVSRSGELKSFDSPLITDGTTRWSMVIANNGTTHFNSQYSVTMQNIFDGGTVAEYKNTSLILPRRDRELNVRIPTPSYIGIYRIAYKIGLGDSPAQTREQFIVFMPAQARLPLAALAILIISVILYITLRRKTAK